MKLSSDRILTTHVGSLPRPGGVSEFLLQKENDDSYDQAGFDACMSDAVNQVVARQVEAGDYLHNVAEYQRFSIRNYHAWLATIDESVRF